MTRAPTFSVIVAAHNAARTLPATIRSVIAQTRSDHEVIVIDDGSNDGTDRALSETTDDPRVVYVRQQNLGPAAARNAGIERARGTYVSLLDSDDLWLPTYLEAMAVALEREPAAALAYTDAWRFDEQSGRIFRKTIMAGQSPPASPPRDPESLLAELLRRNFVYTSATVRRETLAEVGGFTTLTRSEDYELWLRIAASGRAFVRADGILAVYRDRPGSRIHDPIAMASGRREIYELALRSYRLSPANRALAASRLAATEAELVELEGGVASLRRRRFPRLRRRARDVRFFRITLPRDVARAFPDLGRG